MDLSAIFANNFMSNRQGNHMSEASAIIPELHENPCDFMLIMHRHSLN